MTKTKSCPPAPGPLEEYAARFDDLFTHVAQRRGFRECLAGLLQPRARNKTVTCLAEAEPVTDARSPRAQRLQFFLSESCWDPDQINERRLGLLLADPATAAHAGGVLVIDDSGDRKDGTATAAFAGRQWLGRIGKTDNGIVTVTGPMNGCTTRCTPSPTPRPGGCPAAGTTRPFAPNGRSRWSWPPQPGGPEWPSAPRWPSRSGGRRRVVRATRGVRSTTACPSP
nr:transposase [Nonomuraea turkmeniaca]